jgi:A/G-specific adenine glycosylase
LTPLQDAVLSWYSVSRRDLPWRDIDDAYAVLVSEIMLQQTQVSRVVVAYAAFLERFPDVRSLAAASRADVLQAWKGLGYNRRAVALHRAAAAIVEQYDGVVPRDLDALQALPGIGAYTARAVLAFAYGRDAAPVDTNIRRVLTRCVRGSSLQGVALQAAADAALPAGRSRDWNAALMDLGSQHCTAQPRCSTCPVRDLCAWAAAGGDDPAAGTQRSAAPFAGSQRYHRGRLLDALRAGDVPAGDVAAQAQVHDHEQASRLADGLVADGLAEWDGDRLRLPI